jgi:hypothetical protein
MSPAVLLTWALVIVVVSFCSGYQLAGYLEADSAERAAAALRCAREAYAASRADADTAREFSAWLLAEAVATRRERETAEAPCGLVELTVTALCRPAPNGQHGRGTEPKQMTRQAQDRPQTALGRSQEQQFGQPRQVAAWSEAPGGGPVSDAAEPEAGR